MLGVIIVEPRPPSGTALVPFREEVGHFAPRLLGARGGYGYCVVGVEAHGGVLGHVLSYIGVFGVRGEEGDVEEEGFVARACYEESQGVGFIFFGNVLLCLCGRFEWK